MRVVRAPEDGYAMSTSLTTTVIGPEALVAALASPDPLVRSHAVWSARRLGCDDLLVDLADDPDPQVRAEFTTAVERRSTR